jgi:hypothetical protein
MHMSCATETPEYPCEPCHSAVLQCARTPKQAKPNGRNVDGDEPTRWRLSVLQGRAAHRKAHVGFGVVRGADGISGLLGGWLAAAAMPVPHIWTLPLVYLPIHPLSTPPREGAYLPG